MGQNEHLMPLHRYLLITADAIHSANFPITGGTATGHSGYEQDCPVECCSCPQHFEGVKPSGCQEFRGHEALWGTTANFHCCVRPEVTRTMIQFVHAVPGMLINLAFYEHPLIYNVNNDPSEMFFIEENHKVLWPN